VAISLTKKSFERLPILDNSNHARDIEQHFQRKHWSDIAGYREAKTTEATTSG
jgi:hypothetical protein